MEHKRGALPLFLLGGKAVNYKVYANGKAVPIQTCNIFEKPYNAAGVMEYVMLTVQKRTEIVVESESEIEKAVIRPLSAGIPFEVREGKIIFSVDRAVKLSVEINGSYKNNLMIFADEEKYADFTGGENCIVFSKGIHNADTVVIDKDHTTLYLEEGAVLNGNVRAENCKDITICGRGMICMEKYTYEMRKDFARSIDIQNCTDVKISDIIIHDSNDWSLRLNGCDNVTVENVKIFGCRGNSDGIDVCGSRNVTVTDIFTRVWDDSFVVKSLGTGNTENVVFKNSVLWNDFARPMEVGVELRADEVKNIRFENIDVIHSSTGYPLMGIHHGDHARVSDIVFRDIRIEDAPGAQLFDIRIADSVWSRDNAMGNIRDITFSDIKYIGTEENRILLSNSRVEGYSAEHDVQNVRFHNIVIDGKAVTSAKTLGLDIHDYVENVSVTSDLDIGEQVLVSADIQIKDKFMLGGDGRYRGRVCVRLTNNNSVRVSGNAALAVSPKNMEREREFAFDLSPLETAEHEFEMILQPGKYVFFLKSDTKSIENRLLYVNLDMVLSENVSIAECPRYDFKNYYGVDSVRISVSAEKDGLVLLSEMKNQSSMDFVLYTAVPVAEEEGEVLFSAEETDFGEVCALMKRGDGFVAAPQLRSPLEITYVFRNEPKVKEIVKTEITLTDGTPAVIPLEHLGLPAGTKRFLLEITAKAEETEHLRYPYTLFHSTMPEHTAHMFGNVIITERGKVSC